MSTRPPDTQGQRQRSRRPDRFAYLFLIPTLALFTGAIILPAAMGMFFSLTNSIGFGDWQFVGLANYAALLHDPAIRSAYGFTVLFAVVTTLLVNAAAFLLALGLAATIKFKTALRTIYVLPMVLSGIIIAYVFQFIFATALPSLGQWLHSDLLSTNLLTNARWAWLGVVLVTAWQAIPSTMLIYLAGLLSIAPEVYEASAIDGANGLGRLTHITMPLMTGYLVINTIISLKSFLNTYDVVVGLTNGGPGTATRSVAMTIIKGFDGGDYAYQMANATVFFLFAVGLALLQLRATRGTGASA